MLAFNDGFKEKYPEEKREYYLSFCREVGRKLNYHFAHANHLWNTLSRCGENLPTDTPKPVIYTIMENTTPIQGLDEIQSKIISQVVSMSMLPWESAKSTSQPLPLHYADKLDGFTQMIQMAWPESDQYPMFI